jgi:hypothetical protein
MEADARQYQGSPFDDLRELMPDSAAERLQGSIETPPTEIQACRVNDRAVIDILADRRVGDPILEHIPLAAIEMLVARCLDWLEADADGARDAAWQLLDVLRRSVLLSRISAGGAIDHWSHTILRLVEASHFTFGALFEQRARGYGERVLFRVPTAAGTR